MDALIQLILPWLDSHPHLAVVLTIVGALRILNKPLFALLHTVADLTLPTWDNELLKKIEESKAYKYFLFAADWLASVKLKKEEPKAEAPEQPKQ